MQKQLQFKFVVFLFILPILSCEKVGNEVVYQKKDGPPTIEWMNAIHAPMEVTINGKVDTMAYDERFILRGEPGTRVVASARPLVYKSYLTDSNNLPSSLKRVGETFTLDLSCTIPKIGTESIYIHTPPTYYLLYIYNNSNRLIDKVTIDYNTRNARSFTFMQRTRYPDTTRIVSNPIPNFQLLLAPIGFFRTEDSSTSFAFYADGKYISASPYNGGYITDDSDIGFVVN